MSENTTARLTIWYLLGPKNRASKLFFGIKNYDSGLDRFGCLNKKYNSLHSPKNAFK